MIVSTLTVAPAATGEDDLGKRYAVGQTYVAGESLGLRPRCA